MSETREVTTEFNPTGVKVTNPVGKIIVNATHEKPYAVVSLSPLIAGDAEALRLIEGTIIEFENGVLVVLVPPGRNQVTGSVSISAGRRVVINQNVVSHGDMIISNGSVVVNGQAIGATNDSTGEVVVKVLAPAGVNARLRGSNIAIHTLGHLDKVRVQADNGSIIIASASSVDIHTSNANVDVEKVEDAEINTSNGSIHVDSVTRWARLRATNGSITATTTTENFRASATNGSVRVIARGVRLDGDAVSTTNGSRRLRHV